MNAQCIKLEFELHVSPNCRSLYSERPRWVPCGPLAAGTAQRPIPRGTTLPPATAGCSVSCTRGGWWHSSQQGLGHCTGSSRACPYSAGTRRWTSVCCKLCSHCAPFPSSLLLCRQPVLFLAHLGFSLMVECRGTSSQVTQICLEMHVSGVKMTLVPLDGHNCISVPQQLLYMSMTADFLAHFCHFQLPFGRI